jgi:hypothetical protein
MKLSLLEDVWWTFIIPIICLFSLITNLINIFILFKLRCLNKNYKYMYLKSINNSVYLFISLFLCLHRCGRFCTIENSYLIKLIQLYFFSTLNSILLLSDLFIEVVITLNRYFLLISKHKYEIFNKLRIEVVLLIIFTVSTVINLPKFWIYEIRKIHLSSNETIYELSINSKYEYSSKLTFQMTSAIRGIFLVLLILVINMMSFSKLNKNVNNLISTDSVSNLSKNFEFFTFSKNKICLFLNI